MALYEYTGNHCPFSKELIPHILNCYTQEEFAGNYSELWGKGRIFQLQNKFEEAIDFYNTIVEHDNTNINAYRMCARVYEEMNDFQNALTYFEKAQTIKKNPLTACFIANIAIKQYNYKKAESILLNAIEEFPNDSFPKYRLIDVLGKLGKTEKQADKRIQLLMKLPDASVGVSSSLLL